MVRTSSPISPCSSLSCTLTWFPVSAPLGDSTAVSYCWSDATSVALWDSVCAAHAVSALPALCLPPDCRRSELHLNTCHSHLPLLLSQEQVLNAASDYSGSLYYVLYNVSVLTSFVRAVVLVLCLCTSRYLTVHNVKHVVNIQEAENW